MACENKVPAWVRGITRNEEEEKRARKNGDERLHFFADALIRARRREWGVTPGNITGCCRSPPQEGYSRRLTPSGTAGNEANRHVQVVKSVLSGP